ncbi:succinate--CoA ligase [GDP-forming] subunit beta, mitochondrial-like isoform X2 [Schistocerca gregaria]|uniref:succinate--CoA ligase [GDP-forming] subunit beta, mitochondrial-like isoform X2 n=1 Tax=Schistocerca gregaria TaxID=7010 RepID=UPI00211E04A3|nr:succinate--CoA ligase [GDP-forming] subunit beta, mitochondrial-like isoform X2 [Schistocerca gregaria]
MFLSTFTPCFRKCASSLQRVSCAGPTVFKQRFHVQEYQSKRLLQQYGLNVQRFRVVTAQEQARDAAKEIAAPELVVKAQILAGGRGLGSFENGFRGGIHLCQSPEDVERVASSMLGYRLRTHQTPPDGILVKRLMIAESIPISREVYVSIVLDREVGGPRFIVSPRGGVDIEVAAIETPDLLCTESINIDSGPLPSQLRSLVSALELPAGPQFDQAMTQLARLYQLFIELDATQVEINPMAVTTDGDIYCVDAKISFDENALFRHPELDSMRAANPLDPREAAAEACHLNYVAMDGNIGCIVNGAGLAMATMDIIKLKHGSPANFLDVGGQVTEETVTEAFKILTSDQNVKVILVNIFGGIVRCDLIANGILNATRHLHLELPLVVRLAGTNAQLAQDILKTSNANISTADSLEDAATKAVLSANMVQDNCRPSEGQHDVFTN